MVNVCHIDLLLEGGGGTMPPILFCCCVGVEAVGGVAAGGVEDFCWGAGLAPCVTYVYTHNTTITT